MSLSGRSNVFAPLAIVVSIALGAPMGNTLPAQAEPLPACPGLLFEGRFDLASTQTWSAQSPICNEQEPNDGSSIANVLCASQTGSIQPIADQDFFRFVPAGERFRLRIETYEGATGSCPTIDTVLTVYDSDLNLVGSDDDGGEGSCSAYTYEGHASDPSPLYFLVGEYQDNSSIPQYGISYYLESFWENEVESNSTPANADPMCQGYFGSIAPITDVDYLYLYMDSGDFLLAETSDGILGRCFEIDTYLQLYDPSGAPVASDDDGSADSCSLLAYTTVSSGIFLLKVSEWNNDQNINFYGLHLYHGPNLQAPKDASSQPAVPGQKAKAR